MRIRAVQDFSALAYHLYSRRPASTWMQVKNRIVVTRGRTIDGQRMLLDDPSRNLKGPADFVEAVNGW